MTASFRAAEDQSAVSSQRGGGRKLTLDEAVCLPGGGNLA